MKVSLIIMSILFASCMVFAENNSQLENIAELLAKCEVTDENTFLNTWLDPKVMERCSKTQLTDQSVRSLYLEFKSTIPNPPDPSNYEIYGIDNGEEALVKVDKLGRQINTMIRVISDEDIEKYGELLASMRNVLILDIRHIPLAIKHDNSRDIYWYDLHNIRLDRAKEIYLRTLGD